MSTDDELISNIHSINIFFSFRKLLSKLWTLWELVLLGEPILILSPSPTISSEAVLSLVSMISPVFKSIFKIVYNIDILTILILSASLCWRFSSFFYNS